jgi:signal transduction histidine kinase
VVLAGIVQDISPRKQAEAEHQSLIAKLLHAEEDERRRIARELHDTTTQHLAVLKITCAQLCSNPGVTPDPKLMAESRQLIDQALLEIRTLTYVLHPPVLEEFGLVGALKDFASGVSRRSNIQVTVHADEYAGRLPRNTELTLFRVVQESVSNAVRHSGTREISIRLARDNQEVRVEVQDSGRGFATPLTLSRNAGVGIAAMHERIAMVGGMLNIESDAEGVTVLASVPLAADAVPSTFRAPMDALS